MRLFEILVDPARDRAKDLSSLGIVGIGEDDVVAGGLDMQRMGGRLFTEGCLIFRLVGYRPWA